MRVDVPDTAAMEAFGRELGGRLRAGDLVVLTGPLGAGKTTLTRGIGAGLGVRGPVQSPTFVLARTHPSLTDGPPLVHVDAYRLGSAELLDDLDLDFAHAVVVVEWGAGLLDDAADSWLDVVIERPEGVGAGLADVPNASGTADDANTPDAANAEFLGADEPRRLTVRGFGPRWAESPFDAAE
jgi:tRNA threonylcarbamoyladenosine biosynthesis protein TsaE